MVIINKDNFIENMLIMGLKIFRLNTKLILIKNLGCNFLEINKIYLLDKLLFDRIVLACFIIFQALDD